MRPLPSSRPAPSSDLTATYAPGWRQQVPDPPVRVVRRGGGRSGPRGTHVAERATLRQPRRICRRPGRRPSHLLRWKRLPCRRGGGSGMGGRDALRSTVAAARRLGLVAAWPIEHPRQPRQSVPPVRGPGASQFERLHASGSRCWRQWRQWRRGRRGAAEAPHAQWTRRQRGRTARVCHASRRPSRNGER